MLQSNLNAISVCVLRGTAGSRPAAPIPEDELQLRAGGKTLSGASPAGSKFLCPLLYPGKVLSKTTGISSAVLLEGRQHSPRLQPKRHHHIPLEPCWAIKLPANCGVGRAKTYTCSQL